MAVYNWREHNKIRYNANRHDMQFVFDEQMSSTSPGEVHLFCLLVSNNRPAIWLPHIQHVTPAFQILYLLTFL